MIILHEDTKMTHQEQLSKTLYIYEDEDTGIKYIYNGEKLVPINAPTDNPEDPGDIRLDEIDKEQLEKEDKEREEQIQKELEELGEIGEQDGDLDGEDAQAKVEEISKLLNDSATAQDLLDETERIVRQDYQTRQQQKKEAEKAAQRYTANNGIADFVIDLNRLIAKEIKKNRKEDWGKINKKYSRSGLLKPGYSQKKNPQIPRLFVYYDQSSSWDSDDIKIGDQAISTLNTYVKKKQLVIEVYYFANHVGTSPYGIGGGTAAGKELIDHIAAAKPDNVVIMTDADFDSWNEILQAGKVTVPGGAFLLFRRGQVSQRLVDRVHGKKFTKIYSF